MRPDSPIAPRATPAARFLAHLAVVGVLLLGSGCIYKMAVQQGNFLSPTQVSQLEEGMTRPQVLFLLGTPMVPNGFDGDRWDYYYYIKVGRRWEANTSRLMILFKDDKVEQIVRDGRIEPPKESTVPLPVLPGAPPPDIQAEVVAPALPPPPNPTEAGPHPPETTPVKEPAP